MTGREWRLLVQRVGQEVGLLRHFLDIGAGIGIGMIPDYMTEADSDLVPVLPEIEQPTLPLIFAYPEELRNSKKVQLPRDFLVSQARDWK